MAKGKKSVIITTIVLGVIALGYFFSPSVKDIIDDKIFNNPSTEEELTPANVVSNIAFDEQSRTLTFGESENGAGYTIEVVNIDTAYSGEYESPTNTLQVELPNKSLTGDTLRFTVIAKGDNVTTTNSQAVEYEYVLQYETELIYGDLQERAYTYFNNDLCNYTETGTVNFLRLDTMEIDGNNLIVKGTATDYYGKEFLFNLQYNLSDYENVYSQDFDNVNEFKNLIGVLSNVRSNNIILNVQYTEDFVQVSNGLIQSSQVMQDYITQGYTISTLQQTNSSVHSISEEIKAFNVNGIYQAFNSTTGDIITFELAQEVQMPVSAEMTTDSEYLQYFNQTGQGSVFDGEHRVIDANLMSHVNIVNQLHNADVSEEQDMQQ